jgi:hypothetical protein
MSGKFKSALAVAALVAAAGAAITVGAGSASAQGTATPWAPGGISQDANAVGGIAFFDAAGNQITGGSTTAPFAAYAVGLAKTRTVAFTDTVANLFVYQPQFGLTPDQWTNNDQTNSTSFPNSAAPAPINSTTLPVASGKATDLALDDVISDYPSTATQAGYVNAYEVRIYTGAAGHPGSVAYDYADITINPTAHTWSLTYSPDQAGTATTTAIPASVVNSATTADVVTLTANVAPAATGTVQFKDGATNIGSAVAVSGGVATTTTTFASAGTKSVTAVFTPAALSGFGGSTSAAHPITVPGAVIPSSSTSLTLAGGYVTAGTDATLTASVAPSSAAGSVAFYDNGSTTAIAGTLTNPSAGTYVLDVPTGFAAGGHSVVAKFTPTNASVIQASQSAAQSFLTQGAVVGACAQTGSVCTDTQYVQASIPVGTLVINTPYTQAHPLDLGSLALSADSTKFSGQATFSNIVVSDTRAGNLAYTVSALASSLTNGGSHVNSVINGQNLGLTTITASPGTGFIGTITPTDNPAANAVAPGDTGNAGLGGTTPHTIAVASQGEGTVTMQGTLTLIAPSSTEAGTFLGTITFTVG